MSDVLVIVPALNEAATVAGVVSAIRQHLDADVLVVDDGSTDATAARASAAGAVVLTHPFNLGVGAALRTGFRYARDAGYPLALQIDADGQHEPADAKGMIDLIVDGEADLVVGSRFSSGYEIGPLRRLSMRVLSRRVSRSLGVRITDTTSGFRAFGRPAIESFAVTYPSAYLSDTVEALLLAGELGLRVVEVPVQMHQRQGGQASSGTIKSLYHLVRLSLVMVVFRLRKHPTGPVD